MKLIVEQINDTTEFLTEADNNGKKNYYLSGIFMQAECVNKNRRRYPRQILENEVGRYNLEYVTKKRAFGELTHPSVPTIDLTKVSHMIEELRCVGNDVYGKAKILDTPNGKIVKSFLDEGAQLGVSTRGVGSLKEENGYNVVQDDFRLATAADIVADPSAPNALVQGIMENREWLLDEGTGIWTEKTKDKIKKMTTEEIEAKKWAIFESFVKHIGANLNG